MAPAFRVFVRFPQNSGRKVNKIVKTQVSPEQQVHIRIKKRAYLRLDGSVDIESGHRIWGIAFPPSAYPAFVHEFKKGLSATTGIHGVVLFDADFNEEHTEGYSSRGAVTVCE
jgi:hypothetical protein